MSLKSLSYWWPLGPDVFATWENDDRFLTRPMPETAAEVAHDSRWPAFFPSPMCFITTRSGSQTALEKVVGASIVNRFPYVMAVSFCREDLSARHHARRQFMKLLEADGQATVQFMPTGSELRHTLNTILQGSDAGTMQRMDRTGLDYRHGCTNSAPIFDAAYMAYEARLVRPMRDGEGTSIYQQPWMDVGSHRIYFLEINAIQLREDIASGATQLQWRSLPDWPNAPTIPPRPTPAIDARYRKGFTADYAFPSRETIAFEADDVAHGMAIKQLPSSPARQVEMDNDRARWPCFFPSSVGMITVATPDGGTNLMPCGSTTIISRHPLTVAIAVSYAAINARYAPRASLDMIRRAGRFGCGVPYRNESIMQAIRYAGNVSYATDPAKTEHSGLTIDRLSPSPRLTELPVHFDCRVVREIRLGTHVLFLGEVEQISCRQELALQPLHWNPWAKVPSLAGAMS